MSEPIAHIEFTDGMTRPVFEDSHGQYVLDDAGDVIYGIWFMPREEWDRMFAEQPIIVSAAD